jgi:hypothetical protein
VNAADVLADKFGGRASGWTEQTVAALLAHGEQGQGLTIEADGEMHPKDPPMTTRLPDDTLWALEPIEIGLYKHPMFRLVPLSAEAGDQGTWMGGGLEITYPSAEAGDTDG